MRPAGKRNIVNDVELLARCGKLASSITVRALDVLLSSEELDRANNGRRIVACKRHDLQPTQMLGHRAGWRSAD